MTSSQVEGYPNLSKENHQKETRRSCTSLSVSTYKAWEPSFNLHQAAEKVEKPHAGSFWWKVGQMKTLDDKERFPLLFKLMAGLLSIPSSDADSERGFSVLRKMHTDQRSNLDLTIVILMSFNCDSCCFDGKLAEELLTES